MNASTYIVAFHIGRGGRFHNPGHKTFNQHIQKLSDCFGENFFIFKEDEDGNALPDGQWQLVDGGSNVILEGRANIESKTGVLDWDGEYDTDIVQYLSECSESEIDLIYQAYLDGDVWDDELKDYVCTEKGLHCVHRIEFFDTHAHVECQDGMIQYDWDGRHDVDEDEAREWMEEQDIDPASIERYADQFEDHFYTE